MSTTTTFPEFLKQFPPGCPMGYTRQNLEDYFGAKEGQPHPLWRQLDGQTGAICTGKLYDHELKAEYDGPCASNPHGYTAYEHDVWEWYTARPVSDW